jgi:hypothetical protein
MFSVAYCTHIVQRKLMLKNHSYPQTLTFTAAEGPRDLPLVVLRYSVGVLGQIHATHSHQSIKNILSTLE